jgi:glycosidase
MLSLVSTAAIAEVNRTVIEREGSVVQVQLDSTAGGTYILRDDQGRPCASGQYPAGTSTLRFDKVAAPTDISFEVRPAGGSTPQVTGYPAEVNISTLEKPDRSSIIYQLPVRTYLGRGNGSTNTGSLDALTEARLREIKELGVDYLWVTGVLEYAARNQTDPDVVKGDAGSYYAIYDNWDVAEDIGGLAEFEALIDRAHDVGLRILIDFVGNHTARVHRTDVLCKQHLDFGRNDRTDVSFDQGNNYYYISGESFIPPDQPGAQGADGVFDTDIFQQGVQLEYPARVTGNDIITHAPQIYDWFETVKLNYGFDIASRTKHYDPRPKTWDQMLDVAKYWVEKGVDGFRCDYAHAVPLEYWRFMAENLRQINPDVFLLAEAYETDARMGIPGFSYQALLDAGFDSVYNSEMYWGMHNTVNQPGRFSEVNPMRMPLMRREVVEQGYQFTHYMENHDEVRLASRHFARWIGEREERARIGLAMTAYLGLLPGHVMIHGGQELQEDATIFGGYAGDNGRTSIFDYIYQSQTRTWIYRTRPEWMVRFRDRYKNLLSLKKEVPFRNPHSNTYPTYIDLEGPNARKEQSNWIASYIRYDGTDSYLVVFNSDSFTAHPATIHFTARDGQDSHGALRAINVENNDKRYRFLELFSRPGFEPSDPNIAGEGIPGWALYRSGDIPSGLYLGDVPAGTTLVFKILEQ